MEDPYFYVQSRAGITKHINGLAGTKELSERCHIRRGSYVLVVGSGNGHSACKIAGIYGCKVVGVDILPEMVEAAKEWAARMHLSDNASFRAADAMNLPFESNTFDAVISESVTAFLHDKQKGIKEYYRVLKKGGYLGLGEITWSANVPDSHVRYAKKALGGAEPLDFNGWKKLMGKRIVYADTRPIKKVYQAIEEMKMDGIYFLRPMYKMLKLYLFDGKFRKAVHLLVRDVKAMPDGFFRSMRSGIYIGKK